MPIILESELVFKSWNDEKEAVYTVVYLETPLCPECGEEMIKVKEKCRRIERLVGGGVRWLIIDRRLCTNDECSCKSKRILPATSVQYKHYGSEVIGDSVREQSTGAVGDSVNEDALDGEDRERPSSESKRRWLRWIMANREMIETVIMEQYNSFPGAEEGRFLKGTLEGFMEYREGADGTEEGCWLSILLMYVCWSGRIMKSG